VYNALDTRWAQGGSTPFPNYQPGRWLWATIEYTLPL
jgi:hypothetical protein